MELEYLLLTATDGVRAREPMPTSSASICRPMDASADRLRLIPALYACLTDTCTHKWVMCMWATGEETHAVVHYELLQRSTHTQNEEEQGAHEQPCLHLCMNR
jgi:hypothetical protein